MVMKSAVEDDDAGWGLGIPEKTKNNANWVDITQEFKGACKGEREREKYSMFAVVKVTLLSNAPHPVLFMQNWTLGSCFMTNCE